MDKKSYILKKTLTLNPINQKVNLQWSEDVITYEGVNLPLSLFTFGAKYVRGESEIDRVYYKEDSRYEDSTGLFLEGMGSTIIAGQITLGCDDVKDYLNTNTGVPLLLYLPISMGVTDYYGMDTVLYYARTNFNARNLKVDWYDSVVPHDVLLDKRSLDLMHWVIINVSHNSNVSANSNRGVTLNAVTWDHANNRSVTCSCRGSGNNYSQSGYFYGYKNFPIGMDANTGNVTIKLYDTTDINATAFQTITVPKVSSGQSQVKTINTKYTYNGYELPYIIRRIEVIFS
jgi:hypothetical protein